MLMRCRLSLLAAVAAALALCVCGVGCETVPLSDQVPPDRLPSELRRTAIPPYTIGPPDQLAIDVIRAIPRPPYRLEPLDALTIVIPEGLPREQIAGIFPVELNGLVNLGLNYGAVQIAGLTVEEARRAIEDRLRDLGLANPRAIVSLAQIRGTQQIRGEHLVEPDGTISLGVYGRIYVAGMTIPEVRAALERHLAQFLLNPEVAVDVIGFNTKEVYVIFDGGGYGQQVIPLPYTGKDTVLSAIAQVGGLPATSSTRNIWVARPGAPGDKCDQVLPVDYCAITQRGNTTTDWYLYPGDRVFVQADTLIAFNNWLNKFLTPVERMFGVTLLANTTVRSFSKSGGGGSSTTP